QGLEFDIINKSEYACTSRATNLIFWFYSSTKLKMRFLLWIGEFFTREDKKKVTEVESWEYMVSKMMGHVLYFRIQLEWLKKLQILRLERGERIIALRGNERVKLPCFHEGNNEDEGQKNKVENGGMAAVGAIDNGPLIVYHMTTSYKKI
ncbi:hypothetical protein KI387_016801, partial [Taxus chinensis]